MLLRLITVISLILFMLLMISGVNIEVALYRSILVFMVFFSLVYVTIFLLNVLRDSEESGNVTVPNSGNSKSKGDH
jgi:NADH:ubiquinone oxidoreductase subunit 5 (subunit L)/multisubunit Na+/H+ antiporter MnhA subunit